MAKKQSRKEFMKQMKGPDEYQKFASRILKWMNDNTMMVWAAVAPVFVIAVGLFVWDWYAAKQESELVNSLGEVSQMYRDENKKAQDERDKLNEKITDIDKKIAAIEKPQDDVKDPKDPKAPKKAKAKKLTSDEKQKIASFKAEKSKIEQQMQDIKADHAASQAEFLTFYKKHSETPQGWVANMQAVAIYLEQKKLDDARKLLAELLDKSKTSEFYQTHARIIYINLLKDSSAYDEALKQVAALEKIADDKLKPVALLSKAHIMNLKGQKDEALKVLDIIQQDHANTPEADQARNFRMIVKGV